MKFALSCIWTFVLIFHNSLAEFTDFDNANIQPLKIFFEKIETENQLWRTEFEQKYTNLEAEFGDLKARHLDLEQDFKILKAKYDELEVQFSTQPNKVCFYSTLVFSWSCLNG